MISDYRDEKLDKWQEGEVGQQYENWIQAWENAEFEPCELEEPEHIEKPELPDGQALADLPDEV